MSNVTQDDVAGLDDRMGCIEQTFAGGEFIKRRRRRLPHKVEPTTCRR